MSLREQLENLERPNLSPSLWTEISRRLDDPPRRAARGPGHFRLILAAAALVAAAATGMWRVRASRRDRPLPGEPSAFVLSAVDLHRERMEGALGFEVCDRTPDDIRAWVCRSSGLDAPDLGNASNGRTRHLECAAIVEAGGAKAAVFAYEYGARPVTLVTARRSDISSGRSSRSWFSRERVSRDAARGVTFRSWADGEQAYVLVASSRIAN